MFVLLFNRNRGFTFAGRNLKWINRIELTDKYSVSQYHRIFANKCRVTSITYAIEITEIYSLKKKKNNKQIVKSKILQFLNQNRYFLEIFAKRVNFHNFHTALQRYVWKTWNSLPRKLIWRNFATKLWKNETFTPTHHNFFPSNQLFSVCNYLVYVLLSRNFLKSMRVNFRNFHTVHFALWICYSNLENWNGIFRQINSNQHNPFFTKYF